MTETPNPHIVDTDTLTGEMHPIRRCVLAIGSNLGDRLNNLQGAVELTRRHPRGVGHRACRRSTRPSRSTPPRAPTMFLNAVVLADTTLSARTLLDRALAIEDAYGRERSEPRRPAHPRRRPDRGRGPPRRRPDLVLPHPRAHERAFVLAPWNDLEPDAELLDQGPVAELLAKAGTDGVDPAGRHHAHPAVSRLPDPEQEPVPDPDPAGRVGSRPGRARSWPVGLAASGRRLGAAPVEHRAAGHRAPRDLGPGARPGPRRGDPRRRRLVDVPHPADPAAADRSRTRRSTGWSSPRRARWRERRWPAATWATP